MSHISRLVTLFANIIKILLSDEKHFFNTEVDRH